MERKSQQRRTARFDPRRPAAALTLLALASAAVVGEMGTLTLTDGTSLRGDIEEADDEVVLRNAAGAMRYPRRLVETIVYDEAPPAPASSPAEPTASAPSSRPAATQPAFEGPEPPPLLSRRDVQRLKLYEFPVDGPAPKVAVSFLRKRGEPSVEELVERDIREGTELEERHWRQTLQRGRPVDKLRLILRATGMKYADRIEIRGDAEPFLTFRRRVLPGIAQGCLKSGCHGGTTAHVWRAPAGPQGGDEFAYSLFYILDRIQTPIGPMIDRDVPDRSALLRYMLPPGKPPLHPPVRHGRVVPVFRGVDDPEYNIALDWVNSLRVSARYDLAYEPPPWLVELSQPAPASQPDE